MARKVSVKKVRRLIHRYAHEEGIGEYAPYLAAQIEQESGFQTNLGSPAGARDIAQFMSATAKTYGVTLGDNRIKDDIRGQVKFMAQLIRQTGSIENALRGYNAGPGAIEASHGFAETNAYVRNITEGAKKYKQFKDAGGHLNSGGRYSNPSFQSTPGIDNSGLRQTFQQQYLLDREDPDALLNLALSLRGAQDVAPSTTLTPGKRIRRTGGGGPYDIKELFWQGPGGINIKDGQKVPQGFVSGHTDHVHVAAGPKGIIGLGKLAQRMGLAVRENPAFGDDVDPVHAEGSYHYSNRAIDVSGDPALMRRYARRVARLRKRPQ